MFLLTLSRFRIYKRCIELSLNYSTKCMTNSSQSNYKCIQLNNCVKYYPLIGNNRVFNNIDKNENETKINPILDNKLGIDKCYILMDLFPNPMSKQINPIVVPSSSRIEIGDKNLNNEVDLEEDNNFIKRKECPPVSNGTKMYADYKIIRDPRAYTHLTVIRRRKMKKHQRRKWRKKMLAQIKKKLLRRNIKKEKLFRAELLAQIKEAEEFDPEKYVKNILQTIDSMPQPETPLQKIERIRDLIRKNRKETTLTLPKYED